MRVKGFTLVELLVVIGIIGVLLSILIPTVNRVRASGIDAQCKSNLRQLSQAVLLYAQQNQNRIPGIDTKESTNSWQFALQQVLRTDIEKLQCGGAHEELAMSREINKKPAFSYGMNGHVMTPSWDRKIDQQVPKSDFTASNGLRKAVPISEVILLADKGVGADDLLRSDDGFAYEVNSADPGLTGWYVYSRHREHGLRSVYRHGGGKSKHVNVAMMDGSVQALNGADMLMQPDYDGNGIPDDGVINGRWVFGAVDWPSYPQDLNCCE